MRQVEEKSSTKQPCSRCCALFQEAILTERVCAAADEIAFWNRCLHAAAPTARKTKLTRIERFAYSRLALLIAHSSSPAKRHGDNTKAAAPHASAGSRMPDIAPDHSDFFPEDI